MYVCTYKVVNLFGSFHNLSYILHLTPKVSFKKEERKGKIEALNSTTLLPDYVLHNIKKNSTPTLQRFEFLNSTFYLV